MATLHLIESENVMDFFFSAPGIFPIGICIQKGFKWDTPVKQFFFILIIEEQEGRW